MTTNDLVMLFTFNRWANDRMLTSVAALSEEQLHRDLKSSFPSVHATLIHMLVSEWIWLERWKGASPSGWPDVDNVKTVAEIRARWKPIEDGQQAVLGGLDHSALERRLSFRDIQGNERNDGLGLSMQHAVNHASYHRGQIATMLRQLGATPTGTDFSLFYREAL